MTENWEKSVENDKTFAALLIDLPKAFDCLPHHLTFAKLNASSFNLSSARLIHGYVSNWKQGTNINSAYSS